MFAQVCDTQNRLGEHPYDLSKPIPQHPTTHSLRGKQCRICLSGVEAEGNPLVAPCQCSGSLQFVHEECIREWVERRLLKPGNKGDESLVCQLCKCKIQIEVVLEYQCLTCKQLQQKIKNRFFSCLAIIIGLVIGLGLLVFTSYELASQVQAGYSSVDTLPKIIIMAGFALDLLLIFYIAYSIARVCLRRRAKIVFNKA